MERETFRSRLQQSAERQAKRTRAQKAAAVASRQTQAEAAAAQRIADEKRQREQALVERKTNDLQAHLAKQVREAGRECAQVLTANGISPRIHWSGWEQNSGVSRLFLGRRSYRAFDVWLLSKDTSTNLSRGVGRYGMESWSGVGLLQAIGLTATGDIVSAEGTKHFQGPAHEYDPVKPAPHYPDINELRVTGTASDDQLVNPNRLNPEGDVASHQFILDAWERTFLGIAKG